MKILKKLFILAVTSILISACSTNSGFVFRSAYNNMDFILKSKLNSYADFNESQQKWIDLSVTDFHDWHRVNQLPIIANMTDSAIEFLNEDEGYPQVIIEAYIDQTRALYEQAYLSSPLFDAPRLLKTLTEKQVKQISERIEENREEYFEEQRKEAKNKNIRIERLDSFLDFFEIKLTPEQRQYVESQIAQFKDTNEYNYTIFKKWQDGFITLLDQREQEDFESRITAHLKDYLTIFQTGEIKDIRKFNRKLIIETTQNVLENLTEKQQRNLTARLEEIKQDINELVQK